MNRKHQESTKYRISTLIFIQDKNGNLLLIKRKKKPNQGKWSPIGGKLKTGLGESPFECAIRETKEETSFEVKEEDMHLFGYISERNYEDSGHWLMFLFKCKKKIDFIPNNGEEGNFGFFSREDLATLDVPETDRKLIWSLYDRLGDEGFAAARVDCAVGNKLHMEIEEEF